MVLLTFSDFIIIRCNLKCRDNPHFHCLYCGTTVLRKAQLEIHLSNCKQKIQSLQKTAAPTVLIGNTPQPSGSAQTAPLLQLQPQPSPSGPHTSVSPTPFTPLSQPQIFKVPPLSSPLSIHTPQPSGSAQTAPLLQLQPQPSPSGPHTSVSPTPFTPLSPKYHAVSGSKRIRVKCIHCGIEVNKKNLRLHIQRKHTEVKQAITDERHFLSQCIDSENGIFAVQKSFFGPSLPIHVQKRAWGANHRIMCEVDQCNTNTDFAFRSGLKAFECNHIKSLAFCPRSTDDTITLNEEELMEMVQQKWFGEDRKKKCIERQQAAGIIGVPLSVEVTIAGPSSKKYISVYEPKTSYYSRLGRVIVVFDSKKITWSCPCNKTKQSCVHKSIAKWHLFQTQKSLFRKVRTTERTDPIPSCQHQTEDLQDQQYPPNDAIIKKMVFYLLKEKRLPADLSKELINGLQPKCEFPRSLIPQETFMKPKKREIFWLYSLYGHGFSDCRFMNSYRSYE